MCLPPPRHPNWVQAVSLGWWEAPPTSSLIKLSLMLITVHYHRIGKEETKGLFIYIKFELRLSSLKQFKNLISGILRTENSKIRQTKVSYLSSETVVSEHLKTVVSL